MAEEIVKLANLNETLEDEVKVVPELTKKMRVRSDTFKCFCFLCKPGL